MRADRLISIMLLLQRHGRLTALALAQELEVTERTIYRDMEALSASGVPVYAEFGPGGGYALLDNYRTNLTALSQDELKALYMISVPGALDHLGMSQDFKSALLKLTSVMPAARQSQEDQVRQRFYLDWEWWFRADEPVPYLQVIQQAVWEDRCMLLSYLSMVGRLVEDTPVDPYGLVSKAGVWFLVAMRAGRPHVYRVADLAGAKGCEQRFSRLPGFQLEQFWKDWCTHYEESAYHYRVTVKVSPEIHRILPLYFSYELRERMVQETPPDEHGWLTLSLRFENLEQARSKILSCGGAVEVLEPLALRYSIADQAEYTARLYR